MGLRTSPHRRRRGRHRDRHARRIPARDYRRLDGDAMTVGPRTARFTRRGALGGAGLAALAGALAACGGDPGASVEGVGGDVVEFVFLGDANQRKQFEELFAEFRTQHPEIDLRAAAKSGSWAQFTYSVATQIAGGHPPDIIQMRSEEHTSELQSREKLVCRLL